VPRRWKIRVGSPASQAYSRSASDGLGMVDAASASLSSPGAWPTFETTGNLDAVSLTTDTATTVPNGSDHFRKDFVNGLFIEGVTGATFRECRVRGRLDLGFSLPAVFPHFEDCDLDGEEAGTAAMIGGRGLSLLRCRIWNAGQGIQGGTGVIQDCFFGQHYVSGEMHAECVLLYGDDTEIFGCSIIGEYKPGGNQTTPGGGFSAALVLYNHGGPVPDPGIWDGRTNCYVHDNLLSLPAPGVYTSYWGSPTDGGITTRNPLNNCDLVNNTYRKVAGSTTSNTSSSADIVSNFGEPPGSGNSITGNVYEDDGLPVQGNI